MPTASPLETLSQEQDLITALVDVMKREQQHLIGADIDALTALTPQKSQMIQRMALLSQQRLQALGQCGYPSKEAGMQAWIDGAQDDAARSLWQSVLGLTRQAKELNRVNGMLINRQMANNQTILNAMRTPVGGFDNSVYGPSGQTVGAQRSGRVVVG